MKMKQPWLKWSENERQNILRDYRNGVSLKVLESQYHRCSANIAAYLRHCGIDTSEKHKPVWLRWSDEHRKLMLSEYLAGMPAYALAQKHHHHILTVTNWLRHLGVYEPERVRMARLRRKRLQRCLTPAMHLLAERMALAMNHAGRPLKYHEISVIIKAIHEENRDHSRSVALDEEVAGA